MLAADSLLPDGHGQALCAADVTVLWDIAQALGTALDAAAGVKRCAGVGERVYAQVGTICQLVSVPISGSLWAHSQNLAEGCASMCPRMLSFARKAFHMGLPHGGQCGALVLLALPLWLPLLLFVGLRRLVVEE